MKYAIKDRQKAIEILRKAKALFGPDGDNWVIGSLHNDGGYCALGAINKAATGNPYSVTEEKAGEQPSTIVDSAGVEIAHAIAIKALSQAVRMDIDDFNDGDDRLFGEVAAAFDKATCNLSKSVAREQFRKEKNNA